MSPFIVALTRRCFYQKWLMLMLLGISLLSPFVSWANPERPQGGEFRINTFTSAWQSMPRVAMAADGHFVVAWMSQGQDGFSYGVYAQRYDALGAAQGSEFRVNTFTANFQGYPCVAMDASGNFVIAWMSDQQDGSETGIYAQRYAANGTPQGSEFRVNTLTTSFQEFPSIAMAPDGRFIIAWRSSEAGGENIHAQRYAANGVAQGNEFRANTFSDFSATLKVPSVAMDAMGKFVITWESWQDGSSTGIYAQHYDANGMPLGGEFQVNTFTTGNQTSPSVGMSADGHFAVTWMSEGQDGAGYGIYAQRYDANGMPLGGEFQVNTFTARNQWIPRVAMSVDGHFVITWMSEGQDGAGYGIYAQRYDANGMLQGGEFQVNSFTANDQERSSVAMDASNNFVIAWVSDKQDGSETGVYAQRYGNTAPIAASRLYRIPQNLPFSNNLLGTDADGDPLTYRLLQAATKGTLTLNPTTGAFTYTPNAGVSGWERLSYVVNDGEADSAPAKFEININTPPVAQDQIFSLADGFITQVGRPPFQLNLFNLDSRYAVFDADGDPLTISIQSPPLYGRVLQPNAQDRSHFLYQGDTTKVGLPGTVAESWMINVNDGRGGTASATVRIYP